MLDALGIDVKTIIFSMVNFLILVGVLGKFLYKPVLGIIAKRKEMIKEQFATAETMNVEAEAKMAAYNQQIANAEEECRELVRQAKERANAEADKIIEDARQQASTMLEKAERDIEQEKEKAIDELHTQIADIALMAAEQIVGSEIQAVGHDAIVEKAIQDARSAEWQS